MFTGLIEAVGEVLTLEQVPGGARLVVATSLGVEFSVGDSVAVNGVCLTVVDHNDHAAAFDLGPETERVTALGTLAPGVAVNLERALRADARLGGHFVLGHVDGVGTITDVRPEADFTWVTVNYPLDLAPGFVLKGSVAVDGISLTIARLADDRFDVQIVPHTATQTTMLGWRPGTVVNLECDVIGKYVARATRLAWTHPLVQQP
ncbi:MAG: riboflavin synthase [Vicinamibacteria bacterium]|nr:riboflavin synthase [Vicinamibacteria bacterium]